MNLFDSHPRTGHIFRECRLPHAPFDQFHGTVPNKATDLFLGMFRQAKMAERIIHRHGKVAESIEQSSIIYKTWRLSYGKLEIVLVREGGSEEDEVYQYDFVKLGADSLIYKDSEDVFEYGRQKPRETYGADVQLEESSVDDFKM